MATASRRVAQSLLRREACRLLFEDRGARRELHKSFTAFEDFYVVSGKFEPFSALFIDAFNPFLIKAFVPVFLNPFRIVRRD